MPIVNYVTDLWWLFYNIHETLTDIVSNVYLFYVSSAGLGTADLDYKTAKTTTTSAKTKTARDLEDYIFDTMSGQ